MHLLGEAAMSSARTNNLQPWALLPPTEELPDQPWDLISPSCPWFTLGSPPSWTCLKHIPQGVIQEVSSQDTKTTSLDFSWPKAVALLWASTPIWGWAQTLYRKSSFQPLVLNIVLSAIWLNSLFTTRRSPSLGPRLSAGLGSPRFFGIESWCWYWSQLQTSPMWAGGQC